MKNTYKKTIAIILAMVVFAAAMPVFTASADDTDPTDSYYLYGDANLDGEVTIDDVTYIQKYLAKIRSGGFRFDSFNKIVSDVDRDEKVSISDVTEIQKYLANIDTGDAKVNVPAVNDNYKKLSDEKHAEIEAAYFDYRNNTSGYFNMLKYYGCFGGAEIFVPYMSDEPDPEYFQILEMVLEFELGDYYFWHGSVSYHPYAYKDGEVLKIEDAYTAEWFSDEDVRKFYNSFYNIL
ncbi:MAG: dockerin type I repeat-containing protein [Oscillospiraceae bacterium]|jgi:hypothetical protein|nr:dockerin type I repeat-containing protein [Oscillospiraceae bacterium]